LLAAPAPVLSLAPMQDVTDWAFWKLMARYGGPDVYWTEYFRVHGDSKPEPYILRSIIENPTGKPAIAQLIGNNVEAMVRNARILQEYEIAAIDLNLGCPAPVVYRKCAGGGLLREPDRIDSLLGALRDCVNIAFTVKTRVGFESPDEFDGLLEIFAKHNIDALTVHGRTVVQMYRPGVRYDLIARAARELKCPVFANGNVHGPAHAREVLKTTGVRGLMIGRGAIRNPWLFDQIRAELSGQSVKLPTGREVLNYIHELWDAEITMDVPEKAQVQRLKKFMNFVGEGVPNAEQFLFRIRRAEAKAEFFGICEEFLNNNDSMSLDPDEISSRSTEQAPAL
jgi:tRNA-dihydrouridine synthase B